MERFSPVLRSTRVMFPFWESTYRMDESLGAGTAYSPSPPATVNHSAPLSPPPAPPPPPRSEEQRLNSSHSQISYAVFCLQKKKPLTTARASSTTRRVYR